MKTGNMNKTEAIAAVISAASGRPTIFTTGYACRIARALRDSDNHFYMTGSMGLAASIGAGVCLASSAAVVVVDGDGSVLMNPGCLVTVGAFPGLRLVHVVLDDGVYASTGGQPTPIGRIDLRAMALSAGYGEAVSLDDPSLLEAVVGDWLTGASGPILVHSVIADKDPQDLPPRVDEHLDTHSRRFSAFVIHGNPQC